MKNIAVKGMTLLPSDLLVICTIQVIGPASLKVKAPDGVYKDNVIISITAITYPSAGATIPDPGPLITSIPALSTKVRADGELVLRLDDETGTITATPQIPGTKPVDYPVSFKVQVVDAGQIKVKAV